MSTGFLVPGLLLAGAAVYAATRKKKVPVELVYETGQSHPTLGLVEMRVFSGPTGYTWEAAWDGGALDGDAPHTSPEDAVIAAQNGVELAHGPWETMFGGVGIREPAPGTFDYGGATIWISEGKSMTVGGVFKRQHQWSATGPDLDMGGTGTAGSATDAQAAAIAWVDEHSA